MADLLRDDTDFEMLKYIEASDIADAGINPVIFKNKKSVFNPETGTNDILLPLTNGGYTKVGEEGVDINRPGAILLDGMEYGPDTPEYQRYYPTPSPLAMTEAPAMGQPVATEAAPEVSPQTQIEDVQSYAQQLQKQQGSYSLEDLTAAGYPEDVIAAAGLDVATAPPQTRTEALTPEEVNKVLVEGGSLFTSDPTLRQQGAAAVEAFAFDLAVEGLRDELAASGMGPRQIEEEIQARTPELMSQAEIASNILFGTKNPLEFGIADFTTAGIMDIQEGYRLFQQSRQGETEGMTGRAIGMGMMLAGVAEATGVGVLAGKLIKKGLTKLQPTIAQMGADAEKRIAQEGDMLFSNPVGPILDRGLAMAGRAAGEAKPSAAELRRQANIQRFGYDPNEAPSDTSYRMQHQPTGPEGGEGIRLDDLTKNISGEQAGYPEDFYSPKGQKIYAQGPSFKGDEYGLANQESYKIIKSVRGNPDAEVTMYRAVPNEDAITTINPGDFVTLSPTYAKLHAASGYGRSGNEAGKVLEQKVKVRDIYWDGNDVNEFGYFPEEQ